MPKSQNAESSENCNRKFARCQPDDLSILGLCPTAHSRRTIQEKVASTKDALLCKYLPSPTSSDSISLICFPSPRDPVEWRLWHCLRIQLRYLRNWSNSRQPILLFKNCDAGNWIILLHWRKRKKIELMVMGLIKWKIIGCLTAHTTTSITNSNITPMKQNCPCFSNRPSFQSAKNLLYCYLRPHPPRLTFNFLLLLLLSCYKYVCCSQ